MKNLPSPETFCQYLWHEYLENPKLREAWVVVSYRRQP